MLHLCPAECQRSLESDCVQTIIEQLRYAIAQYVDDVAGAARVVPVARFPDSGVLVFRVRA